MSPPADDTSDPEPHRWDRELTRPGAPPQWRETARPDGGMHDAASSVMATHVEQPSLPEALNPGPQRTAVQVLRIQFLYNAWAMTVMALVAALTLISIGFYVAEWVRHMNAAEMGP
jgi:hypothetical protein